MLQAIYVSGGSLENETVSGYRQKGQILLIQVVISSRFPKLTNLKASSKTNRVNLINVPILSSPS